MTIVCGLSTLPMPLWHTLLIDCHGVHQCAHTHCTLLHDASILSRAIESVKEAPHFDSSVCNFALT